MQVILEMKLVFCHFSDWNNLQIVKGPLVLVLLKVSAAEQRRREAALTEYARKVSKFCWKKLHIFRNLLLHLWLGRWNWETSSGTAGYGPGVGCLKISKWRASDLLQGCLENLNLVGLNWQGLWYEQVWQTGVCNLLFSVMHCSKHINFNISNCTPDTINSC